MAKQLLHLALALCLTAPAIAQADLSNIPQGTHDWGCEVLLCLSNPAGPMAVAECVPPIRRLWRELARGHAFPTCAMATGPAGRSYARPTYGYYERCPEGTTELAAGEHAKLSAVMPATAPPAAPGGTPSSYAAARTGQTYTGIGSGDGYGQPSIDNAPPPKVCVAGYRGSRQVFDGNEAFTVQRYDSVFVSPAQPSPRAIEVFIDDAYWQTVHW
jgi:hypothetical protein